MTDVWLFGLIQQPCLFAWQPRGSKHGNTSQKKLHLIKKNQKTLLLNFQCFVVL